MANEEEIGGGLEKEITPFLWAHADVSCWNCKRLDCAPVKSERVH